MNILGKLKRGAFRLRYGWEQRRHRAEANGLPIPPPDLNALVTGAENVVWYVRGGRQAYLSLEHALHRNLIPAAKFRSILDFGCGSGRVIRYWKGLPAEVHGTDINPRLIEWCRKKLPFAQFRTNPLRPPFTYADGQFDFIYALSVFTHLDEPLQFAWRDELARVLRPGGCLVLTTHGPCPFYLAHLDEAGRQALLRGEMVVKNVGEAGANACASFHPEAWVRERLARGFEVVDYLRGGSFGTPFQDLWLLRKPAA
jgi:SAM-dependent methyltransferase